MTQSNDVQRLEARVDELANQLEIQRLEARVAGLANQLRELRSDVLSPGLLLQSGLQGMPVIGPRQSPSQTVNLLGVDLGHSFIDNSIGVSDEGQLIYRALKERGLIPQPERNHVFNIYSPDSRKSIAIGILPFAAQDLSMEAGLSISQGGHAQAVLVHMEERVKLVAFETLVVEGGQLKVEQFTTEQLTQMQPRQLAANVGKIKSARPLIEILPYQAISLANITYNNLLSDDIARAVHSNEEFMALRANADIISEIGQFVLFRTAGSSCCSCSCSCWGSSSCSCSSG